MASVYILFSPTLGKHYIGSCVDFDERFQQHLNKDFKGSYTTYQSDWELFFKIDGLDYDQARRIELHIKRMKSRQYIMNIKEFPSISQKLIARYASQG